MAGNRNDPPDDAELFRQAMAGTRPLNAPERHRAHEHRPRPPLPGKGPRSVSTPPARPVQIDRTDTDPVEFARSGVSKPEFRSLKSGRAGCAAELDLHGLTQAEADRSLERFVREAIDHGESPVRIVHGKGLHSGESGAVLKSFTMHWLKRDPRVRAFCTAPPNDGGALSVMLDLGLTEQGS